MQMGAAVHRKMAHGADGAGRWDHGSSEPAARRKGGVVSPILANLFLHYAFDLWMARTHPDLPWCRYADDGLVHCRSEQEAQALKAELQARLAECRLEMHPTKTKIVYCKDGKRKGKYPNVKFDFLGYCFRPRLVQSFRDNDAVLRSFNPAVSPSAMKAMREAIRDLKLRHQTQLSLQDIARQLNPLLRGWIEYYGRYAPLGAVPLAPIRQSDSSVAWVMRKFKRFKAPQSPSESVSTTTCQGTGRISSFTGGSVWPARLPDGSRVRREPHARFCERLGVKFPRPTHPAIRWRGWLHPQPRNMMNPAWPKRIDCGHG